MLKNLDFTLKTYKTLSKALINQGVPFQTFQEFIKEPKEKAIILRPSYLINPAVVSVRGK